MLMLINIKLLSNNPLSCFKGEMLDIKLLPPWSEGLASNFFLLLTNPLSCFPQGGND
jgi:hypothetical protein